MPQRPRHLNMVRSQKLLGKRKGAKQGVRGIRHLAGGEVDNPEIAETGCLSLPLVGTSFQQSERPLEKALSMVETPIQVVHKR